LVVHDPEIAGMPGVATAQGGRRVFDHAHRRARASSSDRAAQRGAATAGYQNVRYVARFAHESPALGVPAALAR
jgi:hypothetical protein